MGGDEFVVLIPGLPPAAIAQRITQFSQLAQQASYTVCGERSLSVSIGSACFPSDGEDTEQIVALADQRMYAAKAANQASTARQADPKPRPTSQPMAAPVVH